MELASQTFGQSHGLRDFRTKDAANTESPHQSRVLKRRRQSPRVRAATTLLREDKVAGVSADRVAATNQTIREGHFEADLVDRQVCYVLWQLIVWADFCVENSWAQ